MHTAMAQPTKSCYHQVFNYEMKFIPKDLKSDTLKKSTPGAGHTEKVRVHVPKFSGGSIEELMYCTSCCKDGFEKYALPVNRWRSKFWETLHEDKRVLYNAAIATGDDNGVAFGQTCNGFEGLIKGFVWQYSDNLYVKETMMEFFANNEFNFKEQKKKNKVCLYYIRKVYLFITQLLWILKRGLPHY